MTVTSLSLIAIGWATLLPDYTQSPGEHLCLICGTYGSVDAVLNVLLFVPLGAGLALLGIAPKRAIVTSLVLSLAIETAQLLFIAGRDSTVGDVLMNTIGGASGFVLIRNLARWTQPSTRACIFLTLGWSALWLLLAGVASFAFAPAFPRSVYYGQIARAIGRLETFSGYVLDTQIGLSSISNSMIDNSDSVRAALTSGAAVVAIAVPSELPKSIAPILRVADANQQEVLMLGERQHDAVFRVLSGASVMRLRPASFVLADAFPPLPDGRTMRDTVVLAASYKQTEVRLSSHAGRSTRTSRILLHPSLLWVTLLPFDWEVTGSVAEQLIGALALFLSFVPPGYWVSQYLQLRRPADTPHRVAVIGIIALTLFVGFMAIPAAFDTLWATWWEVLAALLGLVAGAGLSLIVSRRLQVAPRMGPARA